jgi:heat shock protein HtpX
MMNAFAVGKPEDSAVAVTDGLIRNLNLRQITGVLAHEVSHIRNGDLKVMALGDTLSRLTGSISTFGLLLGLPAAFITGGGASAWAALGFIVAAHHRRLAAAALSRTREYDADLDAAGLTGDPEGLASALQVLEQKQGSMWEKLVCPAAACRNRRLLRSHPKTEDRVARLLSLRSGAKPVIARPDVAAQARRVDRAAGAQSAHSRVANGALVLSNAGAGAAYTGELFAAVTALMVAPWPCWAAPPSAPAVTSSCGTAR